MIIVRKLQIPYNPEAGFGALTSYDTVILNEPLVDHLRLSSEQIEEVVSRTRRQIAIRKKAYSGLVRDFDIKGLDVILELLRTVNE